MPVLWAYGRTGIYACRPRRTLLSLDSSCTIPLDSCALAQMGHKPEINCIRKFGLEERIREFISGGIKMTWKGHKLRREKED